MREPFPDVAASALDALNRLAGMDDVVREEEDDEVSSRAISTPGDGVPCISICLRPCAPTQFAGNTHLGWKTGMIKKRVKRNASETNVKLTPLMRVYEPVPIMSSQYGCQNLVSLPHQIVAPYETNLHLRGCSVPC